MTPVPDKYQEFWRYLSESQQDLILEGQYLMNDVLKHNTYNFKDYSFLVFPFAKAYEGFLKQLFKDIHFISHLDYISDHLRLGKLLSPNLEMRLGDRSLYGRIKITAGQKLADEIWNTWRIGRNEIFHYFPHNLKSITFREAEDMVNLMLSSMQSAYFELRTDKVIKQSL